MPCSVAQTLDLVGDWWTLLVVREAFLGVRRFADFQDHLGIARNILADRLRRLVANDILSREPKSADGRGHEYRLTEKGRDLWSVLTALRLWGDKWVYGHGNEPLIVRDRDRGAVVRQLLPADADGRPLDPRRLVAVAGPGTPAPSPRATGERSASHRRRQSRRARRGDPPRRLRARPSS
jgi:DNA-binding HxlR family transcriptional regulator